MLLAGFVQDFYDFSHKAACFVLDKSSSCMGMLFEEDMTGLGMNKVCQSKIKDYPTIVPQISAIRAITTM